ncbi:High-osmolarity-induced transcription protein 1 [Purpureocillium lavendulum]|uniref:High-osmolarity-induced transcription protein 1 n=1 Tax=Purpureocillium lavendulum TaxID=1247861 RepID=A0AB34FCJ0_9HYPO|nr:High-osmolarity-induced transcription protein 1 [Purpureocillium lavendulum]
MAAPRDPYCKLATGRVTDKINDEGGSGVVKAGKGRGNSCVRKAEKSGPWAFVTVAPTRHDLADIDLVEVHVHDDVVSIEANDDQGENDDQEDNDGVGNIDDEHTADADANDHHGESDDANGNGSDAHATENRGVGRNIYSLDPESPLGPLGRPQASEPGSDVPALEPTGNSSPQRSMSPEVDAALQAPRTPLPAVDDFSYEWLPLPTDPFEENANGDLDEFLHSLMSKDQEAPEH